MSVAMIRQAEDILRLNDKGTFTVPTHGLYPFQWNWDSALSALGFVHFDEARAWREIETLFDHQWDDGMVPHIIFHEENSGYFPGPEIWSTDRSTPTSGISQPPVAGFAVRRIFDTAKDRTLAEEKARDLLPRLHAWHRWFFENRDPEGTGLVAIIHPWESGRDNSVDWDDALSRVPTEGVIPFYRRDIHHAHPDHRPTNEQYDRYIWLVQTFRGHGWDNALLHDVSPFQMVDPGFNAILIRSCFDIADLADTLGEERIAREARVMGNKAVAALELLWNDKLRQYLCFDRKLGAQVESPSVGGLLPAFAPIPANRISSIVERIEALGELCNYLIPSHDLLSDAYDGRRYWRGPAWLIVNFMIGDGLSKAGETALVERLKEDSMRLIRKSGFAEYYDPITAEPCGGPQFTWTAAMVIELMKVDLN